MWALHDLSPCWDWSNQKWTYGLGCMTEAIVSLPSKHEDPELEPQYCKKQTNQQNQKWTFDTGWAFGFSYVRAWVWAPNRHKSVDNKAASVPC
jgi:hypothetical protein